MAQRLVYHWKHGWIPLDHYAALSKAHGRESGARLLEKRLGLQAGDGKNRHLEQHLQARASQLRDAAAAKRAEAERIANSTGAPDRAGAMLRAKDSNRMNQRMDSSLRRYTEAQRQAKALESQAHLAQGRAKSAAEKQDASDLALTTSKMSAGDLIQHKGAAHMVTKVNRTTVSVPSVVGGSWEDKVPISEVSKHVPLAQMRESTLRTLYARAAGNDRLRATYAAELKRRGLTP
jgi:hypothetical protein